MENVFRLQIMNGTEQQQRYTVSASGLPGLRLTSDANLAVEATGIGSITVRLQLPAETAQSYRGVVLPIQFSVQTTMAGTTEIAREKSTFIVPR